MMIKLAEYDRCAVLVKKKKKDQSFAEFFVLNFNFFFFFFNVLSLTPLELHYCQFDMHNEQQSQKYQL